VSNILSGTAKSDSSMKEAIFKALEQVNIDVTERRWQSYYLDVSDRFKDVIKDTSFEQLLKDFAELDNRIPVTFNAYNFVDNKIYYLGMGPRKLSKLNIHHNNFDRAWEFSVTIRYIKENKYSFIEARVMDRQAWP
jgi:hypothetical protein